MKRLAILFILLLSVSVYAQNKTQNIILITLDGVRTEEMFGGLDLEIFKSVSKDTGKSKTFAKFWAETPEARREKLMPFLWGTLLKDHGSIAGNRALKSEAKVTNKHLFSYPGYSEMLTGQPHDDVIKSNEFGQNPYPSVLDFLLKKLALQSDQVADVSSWAAFERIATNKPGSFFINAGYKDFQTADKEIAAINKQQFQTLTASDKSRHDFYTFKFALAHMKASHPRVMHIGFGETDEWAHDKNYERVLDTLNSTDGFIKEVWQLVQTDPLYKDKTTIIITTDHGRGSTDKTWMTHWFAVPESANIWMAFISPDVKLRGEWKDSETVYQNQMAATMGKFLNVDYSEQNPDAGKPIGRLFDNK